MTESESAVLFVEGEVDMSTSPVLEAELETIANGGSSRIACDLRGVSFLDSSGLAVLLRAHQRAQQSRGEFWLQAVDARVLRTLQVTGIDRDIQIR